ncbi:SRPBCC family protein [Croceicoccus sp. F390]|uniref:SRPBCC family protein n=1 Tax=Croceicoccus esteveae TaxID=3075597 RepID=A0ABU2ZHX9_9SPHN|nr:SRPBCC family protein [Croceicoccus sp. F390]MDT0576200.1 SRPBCC family protein [Croceicoccus sp. F390]
MTTDMKTKAGTLTGVSVALGAAAVGAWLATRDRKHHPDNAPGWTQRRSFGRYEVVGRTVTIRKERAELFAYWRDFSNLPRFMFNLDRVENRADGRTAWFMQDHGGDIIEVDTEVVKDVQNKLIAWRSVEGSDVDTEGRVTFDDAPGDRGTRVSLIIAYKPRGGAIGKIMSKLFMDDPRTHARHDLKRFKMLMETGEIATSANRPQNTRAAQKQEN